MATLPPPGKDTNKWLVVLAALLAAAAAVAPPPVRAVLARLLPVVAPPVHVAPLSPKCSESSSSNPQQAPCPGPSSPE